MVAGFRRRNALCENFRFSRQRDPTRPDWHLTTTDGQRHFPDHHAAETDGGGGGAHRLEAVQRSSDRERNNFPRPSPPWYCGEKTTRRRVPCYERAYAGDDGRSRHTRCSYVRGRPRATTTSSECAVFASPSGDRPISPLQVRKTWRRVPRPNTASRCRRTPASSRS